MFAFAFVFQAGHSLRAGRETASFSAGSTSARLAEKRSDLQQQRFNFLAYGAVTVHMLFAARLAASKEP